MKCTNCGAELENGTKFCGTCGNVAPEIPTPVTETIPVISDSFQYSGNTACAEPLKQSKSKLIGIIACGLALLLALWGIFAIFGGGSAEKATKKYYEALYQYNFDKMEKYSAISIKKTYDLVFKSMGSEEAKEAKEELKEKYGTDNIKKIFEKNLKKEAVENFQELYGKNYKIEVFIKNTDELSKDESKTQIDLMQAALTLMDIDTDKIIKLDKIKKITLVNGYVKISGKEDSDKMDFQAYCAKIGGKWKVLADPSSALDF